MNASSPPSPHAAGRPIRIARFSAGELRLIMRLWPLIERRSKALGQRIRGTQPPAGARAARWAALYELPFPEHLAAAAVAFDMDRELIGAASEAIPIASLAELTAVFEKRDSPQAATAADAAADEAWLQSGYLHSLRNALRSLVMFGHPLNSLIARAREHGDERALFDAIRIDPSVLTGATGSARLARALLQEDRRWLRSMKTAIHEGPAARHLAGERVALQAIGAMVGFDTPGLSERALSGLFRVAAREARALDGQTGARARIRAALARRAAQIRRSRPLQ